MELFPVSPARRRRVLGFALACSGAARASAGGVLAVLSSDSSSYREAYEGFQEEWGPTVPFVLASERLPSERPDVIVAFGSRAALSSTSAPFLVTCLALEDIPRQPGQKVLRVDILPAPALLASRMKRLLPRLRRLRVLWSSDAEAGDVAELAAAAGASGFQVDSERIDDPGALPADVRSFAGRADALWLMPDPALVNVRNFAILREYAAAERIPFLAPTEGLVEKGATATLAASFRDVGRAAAEAAKRVLNGAPLPAHVHPDRLSVTVGAASARAAGMDLGAAIGVDRTLP